MASHDVVLALGGNLGKVEDTFRNVTNDLAAGGFTGISLSSFYRTEAFGCAPGTPDFLNAAVRGVWNHSLEELHGLCKRLEEKYGRPNDHESYASRTLDLDIIFFGKDVIDTQDLTIPHREAASRLFVLVPLAEIAGECQFPGMNGKLVREILEDMKNDPDYGRIMSNKRSNGLA